jgi:hypothetical protein
MRISHFIILLVLPFFYVTASAQRSWTIKDSTFSFILKIDSIPYNDNSGFYNTVMSIDVYKIAGYKKIQTIVPPSDNSFESYLDTDQVFIIEDMNFDGHSDIRLLNMLDARLQSNFNCWLYNPGKGIFERDTTLDGLTNPTFNKKTKKIEASEEDGASEQEEYVYHYSPKGKLVLEYQKSVLIDLSGKWKTTTTRKLVNGRMKETSSTTKND